MATTQTRALTLTPFIVTPKAMHELIIMPQFGDVLDDSGNVTLLLLKKAIGR